ncbi:MAG: HDIG domain-containing protein [Leptolyngbya sp. DLM2.Bin15]|nr:MAG: HDIG domain-containing protein [Leptolyngbya sp. DLM2.Bin15]
MKSFRRLTQQLDRWRQSYLSVSPYSFGSRMQRLGDRLGRLHHPSVSASTRPPSLQTMTTTQRSTRTFRQDVSQQRPMVVRGLLTSVAILSLTSVIGYRFYNEPQLAVDTTAPETLTAPDNARIEDTKTTEEARQAARTGSIPVLMIDETANQTIYQSFDRLLQRGNDVRRQLGGFPYMSTSHLSPVSQRYLQRTTEWEWRGIWSDARQGSTRSRSAAPSSTAANLQPPPPRPAAPMPANSASTTRVPSSANALEGSQHLAMLELRTALRDKSEDEVQHMESTINRARDRYRTVVDQLENDPDELDKPFGAYLLDLTDEEWTQAQGAMRQVLERMLLQGIPPGLPSSIRRQAIQAQVAVSMPDSVRSLAVELLDVVVRPNLTQDPEQTRIRAEQAAEAIDPEMVTIRRGETIVEAGDTITQADFVLLDHFGMSRRRLNYLALAGFAALISGAIAIFWLSERIFYARLRLRDHILILLLVLTAPLAIALGLPGSSLPAIGLLIGSFYGSPLSMTVIALLGLVLPIGMEVVLNSLLASAAGSTVGAILSGRLRSREELALLGLGVGLTQGVVYLILSLMLTAATSPVWYAVLTAAGIQTLLGIAWSVVALGVSPYLEHGFDLVTPTRLVELANPNRPLLKRLVSEAPGTFQHTLFVATLAEAAARALGCNVELIRTGTLYHDIGKMHDAMGFIENQMGGPNKHDLIDDPWKSAAIIKKHVTEGLVMARKCRLPRAVRSFIPEHQGTMLITYFYYQAQERAKENPNLVVNEADFRYDGPIPQSRETGIVMLADSCEAALRSLKDATPQEALSTVNKIMRHRWQDNQLVDSGLSRADLAKVAEIFVQVWQQFNHKRIPYPKAALNPTPSATIQA